MKKPLIASLVGGLILFVWQFMSWQLFNLHYSQNSYTANQDEIHEFLRNNLTEGEYFIKTVPKGASNEEMQALQESVVGQPWMQIKYHEKWDMNMPMNLTRGLVIDILSVFLLCWLLGKIPDLTIGTAVVSSLFVGLIGYFTGPYLNSIWFETATLPDLFDAVVQFGLVGLWLGYFLRRN